LAFILIFSAIAVTVATSVIAFQTHNRWWTLLDLAAFALVASGALLARQIAKRKPDNH
jgi:hypothetical protein